MACMGDGSGATGKSGRLRRGRVCVCVCVQRGKAEGGAGGKGQKRGGTIGFGALHSSKPLTFNTALGGGKAW